MPVRPSQLLPERLPPDPVIEAYKKDVDRTLIRAFRRLTPEQRLISLQQTLEDANELRRGMVKALAEKRAREADK